MTKRLFLLFHNVVIHPISGLFYFFGAAKVGRAIHGWYPFNKEV
jgi:hypothetical protein